MSGQKLKLLEWSKLDVRGAHKGILHACHKKHPVIENTWYSCPPLFQSLRPSLRRAPKKRHPNEPIDYSFYFKGNHKFANKKKEEKTSKKRL